MVLVLVLLDIVEKTNVNRFSLYGEFQNKEGLLESSLTLYKERYGRKKIDLLQKKESIQEVLINFYMSFMADSDQHPPGCFIIHTSTELADSNPMVKKILNSYLKEIE